MPGAIAGTARADARGDAVCITGAYSDTTMTNYFTKLSRELDEKDEQIAALQKELARARQTNAEWLEANGPNGWIGELRDQAKSAVNFKAELRTTSAERDRLRSALEQARQWFAYRMEGKACGGSTSTMLTVCTAALIQDHGPEKMGVEAGEAACSQRELLELAARAAGEWPSPEPFEHVLDRWNPRDNDRDASNLEALLRLDVEWGVGAVKVGDCEETFAAHDGDWDAARRWAGVRAAANFQLRSSKP